MLFTEEDTLKPYALNPVNHVDKIFILFDTTLILLRLITRLWSIHYVLP